MALAESAWEDHSCCWNVTEI